MTVRPEVIRYLKTYCGRYPDGALKERLIADGVPPEEIDGAFAIVNLTRAPAPISSNGGASRGVKRLSISAPPKPPRVPWAKRLAVIAAGALFLGGVAAVEVGLKKFRSPETKIAGESLRDALAPSSGGKSAAPTASDTDAFSTYAQMAYRSLVSGRNSDAIRYADMAVESWSDEKHGADNRKALLSMRARAFELTGQNVRALEDYDRIVLLDPKNVDAHVGKARIYLAVNDFSAALEEAGKVRDAQAANPAGHAIAAAAYARLGRSDRALQSFSRAIDAFGTEAPEGERGEMLSNLRYNRGVLLANGGRHALAKKDLDAAIALSPKTVAYYRARAQISRALGKTPDASADDAVADRIASDGADAGPRLGLGPTLTPFQAARAEESAGSLTDIVKTR